MYERLKSLVPRRWLVAHEPTIRAVLAWFYRGSKYECNLCGYGLARFIAIGDDQLCPRCGSLRRTRRLFAILSDGIIRTGDRVLDFSPSRPIFRKLRAMPGISYTASDFAGEFLSDYHFDITRMDVADASYDLIICYHVLEHVEDDAAAMAELHRVLRDGGTCLVQTPFRAGDTYEDSAMTSPDARRKHFGQEDHVRVYSVAGLAARLQRAGLLVDVREFAEEVDKYHGLATHEVVVVASKQAASTGPALEGMS